MSLWPGPRPLHGDRVALGIGTATVYIVGEIVCQGVLEGGRGYAELTVADGSPEDEEALKAEAAAGRGFAFELYRDGDSLYVSPELTLVSTRRTDVGALVLRGAPLGAGSVY